MVDQNVEAMVFEFLLMMADAVNFLYDIIDLIGELHDGCSEYG